MKYKSIFTRNFTAKSFLTRKFTTKSFFSKKITVISDKIKKYLPVALLAFLYCIPCQSLTITSYAADETPIDISIIVDTDTSKPVMPGEEVGFKLLVDNKGSEAWVRIHTSVSSVGIDNKFTDKMLHSGKEWLRKGQYLYLTRKAKPSESLLAIDGFRLPDFDRSEGAGVTISVRAEAIDTRAVTPDFSLDDPWKGLDPDSVANYKSQTDSVGSMTSSSSGGSGRNSSGRKTTDSLHRYDVPMADALLSSGSWECIDAENKLWKFKDDKKQYAKNGWYYIYNSYAGTGGKTQWFYFDDSEYMHSGWSMQKDMKWYHLHEVSDGSLGSLDTGWYTDSQDGKQYRLDTVTGIMLSGWQTIDGNSYYFATLNDISGPSWVYKLISGTPVGRWIYDSFKLRSYGTLYINEYTPDGSYVDSRGAKI